MEGWKDTFGYRLAAIIKHYGLTKNSFSLKIGQLNNSLIVRMINNPTMGTSLTMFHRILNAFPDINPGWLLNGKGNMLISQGVIDPKYHYIDYFKKFGEESIDRFRISGFTDCDFAFDVYGDTMDPKFRQGDIILCKETNADNMEYGEAYLIIAGDRPLLRYVKSKVKDQFKLGAENEKYEDSTIDIKEVQQLFIVKGFVRRVVF